MQYRIYRQELNVVVGFKIAITMKHYRAKPSLSTLARAYTIVQCDGVVQTLHSTITLHQTRHLAEV